MNKLTILLHRLLRDGPESWDWEIHAPDGHLIEQGRSIRSEERARKESAECAAGLISGEFFMGQYQGFGVEWRVE